MVAVINLLLLFALSLTPGGKKPQLVDVLLNSENLKNRVLAGDIVGLETELSLILLESVLGKKTVSLIRDPVSEIQAIWPGGMNSFVPVYSALVMAKQLSS